MNERYGTMIFYSIKYIKQKVHSIAQIDQSMNNDASFNINFRTSMLGEKFGVMEFNRTDIQ